MQCPKCNSLVLDGSRFCVNCGCQLINNSKTNGQKTMAQQMGLNNPVIVDTPQQLKAAINKNCAEIYLTDKSLSDEMGLFSSPTAALAWAVLLLVALFNGLAIIAYLAILIAVICHGLAFLRFFVEGKYKYKKYVSDGIPPVKGTAPIYYVHRKYVHSHEMNSVRMVDPSIHRNL